jgi:hypothetical protein
MTRGVAHPRSAYRGRVMSRRQGEPALTKRKPIPPKPARFTGGTPLDPEKPPVFVSEKSRQFIADWLNDPGRCHRMARKMTCEFRGNPATDSHLMPAGIPI